MHNEIILQTHDLKKYFGMVRAVDGVSLSVKKGQIYGFLGPNGSGKTTTIGLILGLLHPTSGSISLFGEQITPSRTKPLKRVGALIGTPSLFPYLSAWQNLELLDRLIPTNSNSPVDDVLELVDLKHAAKRKAGQFSTGMKQRLGIAMSLLHDPELLILDEPTNGMDPAGMHEIRNLLTALADRDVTVFISSHLLHEVQLICDHVAILNQGKVVKEAKVNDLQSGTATVKVRVASPTKAVECLRTLSGCQEIRPNGAYITVSGVSSQAVITHLVSNGVIPGEVTTKQLDLESIFLELTSNDVQEV